ncbi:VOC family protein [Candidatus Foliamicus sp.]
MGKASQLRGGINRVGEEIVAPHGSPLRAAVIGCRDLDRSRAFYRDRIGLSVLADEMWSGPDMCRFWNLSTGATARAVLLGQGDETVGQVLLLKFQMPEGSPDPVEVRDRSVVRAYGAFNLNFYTADIHAVFEGLKRDGFVAWSAPVQHHFGPEVGDPIEGIFEGPDRVPINLVELATEDTATRVGQMRAYVEQRGYTSAGFTPIVTSSHGVDSSERAMAWYGEVLGMGPLIDEELGTPESNRLLNLPEDAKTRVVFMQGAHMFGKIVLAQPLNYECESLIKRAKPPNIGYLAQAFSVADLDEAARRCKAMRVEVVSPPREIDWPGAGQVPAMLARTPGSGALQLLLEERP